MKKSHAYEINHLNNTVTVTKRFLEAASQMGTDEFVLMEDFKRMGLRPVVSSRAKSKTSGTKKDGTERVKRITYKKMEAFIQFHTDAETMLAQFEIQKELAKTQDNPYQYVLDWFNKEYPNYGEIQKLNKDGKIERETKDNVIPFENNAEKNA